MREKVTASIIFKDRKASYCKSVSHPFLGDYVRLRQNVQWKKISVENNDQYVVFADIINKITRSSGKVKSKNFIKFRKYMIKKYNNFSLFQYYWCYQPVQCYYWTRGHYRLNIVYLLRKYIDYH